MSPSPRRKGILLAGGDGLRLSPLTKAFSKQLMPVYDKPMIYYPICTLMLADIKDILIICTADNHNLFQNLLGSGKLWGVDFSYKIQEKPEGIAQSILIGRDFIGKDSVALILGDNLFHGSSLVSILKAANTRKKGATVFAYAVSDPERYGVVSFDKNRQITNIIEKPKEAESQYAITGLYFYDNSVIEKAKNLIFSNRGELEITDINKQYLKQGLLNVELMGRGMAWLDTGTIDSLHEASTYIRTIECRQGLKVSCPEEIAWRKGWIDDEELANLAKIAGKSGYGEYLLKLIKTPKF